MLTTPKTGYTSWNLADDNYDYQQLAGNWQLADYHDHSPGRGVPVPAGGLAPGAAAGNVGTLGGALSGTLPNPVSFGSTTVARAYRLAAYTTVATTFIKFPLDTTLFDPGSNFTVPGTGYVCPKTGYYQVSGSITFASAPTTLGIFIYNGASQVTFGYSGGASAATVSDIVSCTAGAVLSLYYYTSSAISITPQVQSNYLSVVRVG